MAEKISQLQAVAVGLGTSTYGTLSASFTRGLVVSKFDANPGKQSVARVPQVANTLGTLRVTKGPLDYDATLGFPLDVGTAASASIGDFLACLMGSETGSVAGGIYTHVFKVLESAVLPWLNLYSTKDIVRKQYVGFIPNQIKFSIKSSDGLIPVEVSGIYKDESDLAATQTITFSTEPIIVPSNVTTITVGGSAVTNFEQVDITLKNEIDKFRPLSTDRTFANAFRKAWSVEIALTGLTFADDTERTKYKNVTTSSFDLVLTDSDTTHSLEFAFPQINYTAFTGPNINDQDLMKINLTGMATGTLANEVITLKNTYASLYTTGTAIV